MFPQPGVQRDCSEGENFFVCGSTAELPLVLNTLLWEIFATTIIRVFRGLKKSRKFSGAKKKVAKNQMTRSRQILQNRDNQVSRNIALLKIAKLSCRETFQGRFRWLPGSSARVEHEYTG